MTEKFANAAQTTLNGSITNSAPTLTVTSAALFPTTGTFRILIGSEIMLVTNVAGNVFDVTRGSEGTAAVLHLTASVVTTILTAGALDQLKTDISVSGSNLGSALQIFKDVSSGTFRHRTLRVSGDVSSAQDPSGFSGEVHIRPVPTGWVNVRDYGAVSDADGSTQATGIATGTDNAAAFEAAIRVLDPIKGGVLHIGFGGYRLARPVIVDRPVTILGVSAGFSGVASGTTIYCDYRVTAFRIGQGVNGLTITGDDDSGSGSSFRDIQFRAVARDTAVTAGDWDYSAATASMPDADAARFSLGQLISVGGAGADFTLARLKATTRSGFKTVYVSGSDPDSGRGMQVGKYLKIDTAFTDITQTDVVTTDPPTSYATGDTYAIDDVVIPTTPNDHVYAVESGPGVGGTEPAWSTSGGTAASGNGVVFRDLGVITTVDGTVATILTMDSAAATSVTDAIVVECPGLYARILSKTSLAGTTTIQTDALNGGVDDLTGVDIRDASAAIDMRFAARVSHCLAHSFEGPGIAILTNGATGQNANGWQIHDFFAHSCRSTVVAHGQNSQAGTAVGVVSVQSREWAFIEDTQAGNTWVGNHQDGGFGMLVRDGCSSTIIGAYHETGTYSSYSSRAQSIGGTGSQDSGGVSDVGGIRNRLDVGSAGVHPHQLVCSPDTEWATFNSPSVAAGIRWRRSNSTEGATGFVVFAHPTGSARRCPIAVVDGDGPSGYFPGELVFPNGFMLGSTASSTLDLSVATRVYRCDDEPTGETYDAFHATTAWRAGDIVFATGLGSEKAAYLRCTRTGNAGYVWTPSHVTVLGDRMRLPIDDGYFYTATSIGSAPHETGTTEPTSADPITDGDITWTRGTASALFDRVGGDLATTRVTRDNAVTLLRRYPVADGEVRSNRWIITVKSDDGSGAVMGEWEVKAAHKRISGTLTQGYAPIITNTFVVGAPGTPTVTMNGSTDVDFNVTGIAATDLLWTLSEFNI